jgi:hypothetical protein
LKASSTASALHHAGLGGGVSCDALGDRKSQHRSNINDSARLLRRQHAVRRFLRAEEHRVEIGGKHLAPFLRRHVDGTAGLGDAGIVDQDGDGAEGLLGGVEGARHGGAVGHIGLDRNGAAARRLDRRLQFGKPFRSPRHQCDRRAVIRQRPGEVTPESARRTGHHRHAAFQAEHISSFHSTPFIGMALNPGNVLNTIPIGRYSNF